MDGLRKRGCGQEGNDLKNERNAGKRYGDYDDCIYSCHRITLAADVTD